tara:strand:- start:12 stop:515 length:504 start_codon:yes stop_codon:yes gene_type:complete
MAEFSLQDYMDEFERVFPEMRDKRGTDEYNDALEDYFRGLASKDREGIMMAGTDTPEIEIELLKELLEAFREKYNRDPVSIDELKKAIGQMRDKSATGGRVQAADGTLSPALMKRIMELMMNPEYQGMSTDELKKEAESQLMQDSYKSKEGPLLEAKAGGLAGIINL